MEKEVTLILTLGEVDLLGRVLVERPFKEVAALFGKINQQLAASQLGTLKSQDQPSKEA